MNIEGNTNPACEEDSDKNNKFFEAPGQSRPYFLFPSQPSPASSAESISQFTDPKSTSLEPTVTHYQHQSSNDFSESSDPNGSKDKGSTYLTPSHLPASSKFTTLNYDFPYDYQKGAKGEEDHSPQEYHNPSFTENNQFQGEFRAPELAQGEYQANLFPPQNTSASISSQDLVPIAQQARASRETTVGAGQTESCSETEDDEEYEDILPPPPASKSRKSRKKAVTKRKRSFKNSRKEKATRHWTASDDDKVAFLREYGNLKWHEVTEFLNGRHTPQAVQMRYLRSLKRRNDGLCDAEKAKLKRIVEEDYEGRFKRIATQMGPSFTPIRLIKIFMQECGMSELLKHDKVWTREEITAFVDAASGDFDSFNVPYRADQLPTRAAEHMQKYHVRAYEELSALYVGKLKFGTN